jgi:dephospho-CoA kinase
LGATAVGPGEARMSDFVVGLTGGVASGKSALAREFAALGVVVADADVAARAALAPGSGGLAEVVESFGPGVLAADGSLDRAAMRRRVFADDGARARLEAIVHPRVRAALRAACAAAAGAYAIAMIPLLAEACAQPAAGCWRTAYPWLDRVLVVDTPEAVQLGRLLRRDGVDEALARRMIAAQATRAARLAIADDVVVNDGPVERLAGAALALDRRYRTLAAPP